MKDVRARRETTGFEVFRGETIEDLYRLNAPAARRLAYLLTGSRESADDIAQEAFIRAIGRLAHLRDQSAFGSYLRRTVVNITRTRFRRRKVEARYLQREAYSNLATSSTTEVGYLDGLQRALLRLPQRQRAAIALRFYEELRDHEIAETLGCAETTVRSLVSRGLASLRTELGGERHG